MSDSIQYYLDELGKLTVDEIVDVLNAQGIKGVRGSSVTCPIAIYLQNNTQKMISVSKWVIMNHSSYTMGDIYYRFVIPQSVLTFIDGFDKNQFPDLIKEKKNG